MSRPFDQIIERPVVSEKSYAAPALNKYIFRCSPDATKIDIKRAIETAFADQKITVTSVNILNTRPKVRQRSRGSAPIRGRSAQWKKAYVTLAPGQKIPDLFGGV